MSSGGKNSSDLDGGDDRALHDPVLRRALDHAPDRGAMPDPRTRDAIRKMAHNLAPVAATVPGAAAPWWRRWFGGGETHARMPWNAAFATVLVATFVTVLWYREPVPDARLDGEARVEGAVSPQEAPPQASPAAQAPSPAVAAQAPQAPPAIPEVPAAPATSATAPAPEPARDAAREEPVRRRADAERRSAPASPARRAEPAPGIDWKPVEPPPLPPPLPAPGLAAAPAPIVPAPPPPAGAVAPPAVAEQSAPHLRAAPRTEEKRESGGLERERRTGDAARAPAAGVAPPPAAAVAKATVVPTDGASAFSALDRWTSFNHVRAGQGMRHTRGDTEGLAALVSTVARSATVPGGDLAAPVEARLELYRGTTLLAVLEIAGDQVRWTPQAGGGPSVGTPPPSALAALRALLTRQ